MKVRGVHVSRAHSRVYVSRRPCAILGRMPFTDDKVREYQRRAKELFGEEISISFEDAKERLRQLLYLYWILAHKPPAEGERPYSPPPPPWP